MISRNKPFLSLVTPMVFVVGLLGANLAEGRMARTYLMQFEVLDRYGGYLLDEARVQISYDDVVYAGSAKGKPLRLPIYTGGHRLELLVTAEGYEDHRREINLREYRLETIQIGMTRSPQQAAAESYRTSPEIDSRTFEHRGGGREYDRLMGSAPQSPLPAREVFVEEPQEEEFNIKFKDTSGEENTIYGNIFEAKLRNALQRVPDAAFVPLASRRGNNSWEIIAEVQMIPASTGSDNMHRCTIVGLLRVTRPGQIRADEEPLQREVRSSFSPEGACEAASDRIVTQIQDRIAYMIEAQKRGGR